MTARHTGAREATAVLVRAEGEVGDEVLAYVREKIDAVVSRAGLPAVTGEVRVTKAAAHHAEHPWSAVADIRVGGTVVVVHAREASSQEVADRLQDRLRRKVDHAAHTGRDDHRPVTPPWRGGQSADGLVGDDAGQPGARSV